MPAGAPHRRACPARLAWLPPLQPAPLAGRVTAAACTAVEGRKPRRCRGIRTQASGEAKGSNAREDCGGRHLPVAAAAGVHLAAALQACPSGCWMSGIVHPALTGPTVPSLRLAPLLAAAEASLCCWSSPCFEGMGCSTNCDAWLRQQRRAKAAASGAGAQRALSHQVLAQYDVDRAVWVNILHKAIGAMLTSTLPPPSPPLCMAARISSGPPRHHPSPLSPLRVEASQLLPSMNGQASQRNSRKQKRCCSKNGYLYKMWRRVPRRRRGRMRRTAASQLAARLAGAVQAIFTAKLPLPKAGTWSVGWASSASSMSPCDLEGRARQQGLDRHTSTRAAHQPLPAHRPPRCCTPGAHQYSRLAFLRYQSTVLRSPSSQVVFSCQPSFSSFLSQLRGAGGRNRAGGWQHSLAFQLHCCLSQHSPPQDCVRRGIPRHPCPTAHMK